MPCHLLLTWGRQHQCCTANVAWPKPENLKIEQLLDRVNGRARPARAIERVSGMLFGQTATQFWALPQICMPPSAIKASSRSSAFILPVGCMLNSIAWLMACGADEAAVVRGFLARLRSRSSLSPSCRASSIFVILRAGFQAAAAAHALAERIRLLLHFRRLAAGRGRDRSSRRPESSL